MCPLCLKQNFTLTRVFCLASWPKKCPCRRNLIMFQLLRNTDKACEGCVHIGQYFTHLAAFPWSFVLGDSSFFWFYLAALSSSEPSCWLRGLSGSARWALWGYCKAQNHDSKAHFVFSPLAKGKVLKTWHVGYRHPYLCVSGLYVDTFQVIKAIRFAT